MAQVRMHAKLLADGGLADDGNAVRCGLLFTADGEMRWAATVAAPPL